ncbi:hypothetical protein D6833_13105, partial [Candidatus Parcubacteria bacterium]
MEGKQPAYLAGAQRPQRLVNRARQLGAIQEAVLPPDTACRVVLLRGGGGLGKTRLLEEVQTLCSPGGKWWKEAGGRVLATELVDLMDIRLHTKNAFVHRLRESLRPAARAGISALNFPNYDAAVSEYHRRVLDNVGYALLKDAAERAETAFWEDYGRVCEERRVVWLVDTVEQIAQSASRWMLEVGLLEEEYLSTHTAVWLREQLRRHKERLQNTTLILTGRLLEGKDFFEEIQRVCEENGVLLVDIGVEHFTEGEVEQYLRYLQEQAEEEGVKKVYGAMLQPSVLERLHRYTEGQPVRLALFGDLLLSGRALPRALRPTEPVPEDEQELAARRWKLEEEVVASLFRPEEDSLRQRILLALVRAPAGLTARQLHYLLDNPADLSPQEWEGKEDARRIDEIKAAMDALCKLAIVKKRPDAREIDREGTLQPVSRLGLQDEVYRIFANHIAPHRVVGKPVDEADEKEREELSTLVTDKEKEKYERRYQNELKERQRMYRLLRDWAGYQVQRFRKELYGIRVGEERALSRELDHTSPAFARHVRLEISESAARRRTAYRQMVRDLELEQMTYALLLDPDHQFNVAYTDLGENRMYANDEEADIAAQELVWRLLHDRYLMRFVEWGPLRQEVKERKEHTLDTLRRVARQEGVTRWIKRLAMRGRYREAIDFAEKAEAWIQRISEENVRASWLHTFARGERRVWLYFARMFPATGEELEEIFNGLDKEINKLKQLAGATREEVVFRNNGREERGFQGHPAELRLRRVISMAAAFAAYIATQLGRDRDGEQLYNLALAYLRETGMRAHRALVLNNLSRLLADQGKRDAVVMCQDALNLRLQLDADQNIGLSHSTLALVYNRLHQPEKAWREAAKARLYFSRVDYPRGVG